MTSAEQPPDVREHVVTATPHPPVYHLYGWRVASQVPLAEQAITPGTAARHDVEVTWGQTAAVPPTPPPGTVVAECVTGDDRWYTVVETAEGYVLRFTGCCEFVVSADLRAVRCHLDPAADPGVASVLLGGTVLAFLLEQAGHCVLHASAVETDAGALAFVGNSGMGKSTMAAILCAAGARMVADDVLRVDLTDTAHCLRGTSELRLRPKATPVVDQFSASPAARETADGRLAVAPHRGEADRLPLRAIVVPRPSRTALSVRVTPVPAAEAVFALLRFPRVLGWRDQAVLSRQFQQLARLASCVPLFEADVPWGPPFSDAIAGELLRRLPALNASTGRRG